MHITQKLSADERGGLYISDLFKILIALSLILSFIYLPKPFIEYIKLTHMCEAITYKIETTGAVNTDIENLIQELKAAYNIDPVINIEGPFTNVAGERRIQLKSQFTVEVRSSVKLVIYRPTFTNSIEINLPLSKKMIGVGHVYWKTF